MLSTAGDVYFDTFSVTEEETVEEPVDPNKELPYSETTGIDEMPPYYDFNAYVEKLKGDIAKAEELL